MIEKPLINLRVYRSLPNPKLHICKADNYLYHSKLACWTENFLVQKPEHRSPKDLDSQQVSNTLDLYFLFDRDIIIFLDCI